MCMTINPETKKEYSVLCSSIPDTCTCVNFQGNIFTFYVIITFNTENIYSVKMIGLLKLF